MDVDILAIDTRMHELFKKDEKNLNKYIEKQVELQKILGNDSPLSARVRNDLEKILETLDNRIENIVSRKAYNFYIMESSQILEKYKQLLKKPIKVSFMKMSKQEDTSVEKEAIISEYFQLLSKYNFEELLIDNISHENLDTRKKKSPERKKIEGDAIFCDNCPNKKNFDVLDGRIYVCLNCGSQQESYSNGSSFKDVNRINITSKYTYERIVHFKDCINQYQGKQNSTIPDIVYRDLEKQFELNGLLIGGGDRNTMRSIRFSKITKEHVLLFLKETKHTKHYEDVVLIHYNLTGIKPDDISHLEQKLLDDFNTLSNLYDKKFKQDQKIDRKSFLNSQYILYQLLKRHKHPCKKEDFNTLKTLDRKSFHEDIYSQLTQELGWNMWSDFG